MGDEEEEYQYHEVEVEGDDDEDDEDYENENDSDEGENENDLIDEEDNEGEGMEYQPTNPLHYLRMIRQILTGFAQEEEETTPPPPAPAITLSNERIAAEITSATKVYPNSPIKSIPSMLLKKELCRNGPISPQDRVHITQRFYPRGGSPLFQYDHQIFCGQYSRDGSSFMSAAQDRRVRLYDSGTWAQKKEIHARHIEWSVIDIDYSPDQRWIIYSSWSDFVHICNLQGDFEIHDALDFSPQTDRFCLFSIKFSPDSTEIMGGSSDRHIYVYDINRKERVVRVHAHNDDINTVCYLDEQGTLLASGSDDDLVKIWDRRLLGAQSTARGINNSGCVGILPGHLQGITHVSPKGDGRHLLSNGKDQCIKLWDLKQMSDPSCRIAHPNRVQYDYRYSDFGGRLSAGGQHPDDKSIQTYRGHRVYQTLIRAYFSPASTTGQRYIYTGSYDGCIYIYDVLTGKLETKLSGHRKIIRDLSWHPYDAQIVSTSWDGSIWKWDLQERDPSLAPFQGQRRYVRSFWDDDA